MRPWSSFDVAFWLLLAFLEVGAQIGPFGALYFLFGIMPYLLLWVPWNLFLNFKVRPWDKRSGYSRLATPFELAAAIFAKCLLENFNLHEMGPALFGQTTAEALFQYRQSVFTREGLGDIEHYALDSDQEMPGFWVESRSTSVDLENDVVIYYVAGPGLGGESAHWNLEFFYYFLVSLNQQGFSNPAIFVADASRAQDWQEAMTIVIDTFEAVAQVNCKTLVLAGHAGGATLGLSLLLHLAQPFSDLRPLSETGRRPDAALLMSPIMDLTRRRISSNDQIDYVSTRALTRYAKSYLPERLQAAQYASPGLISDLDLWSRALPIRGLFISAGSEEVLLPEIKDFAFHLKDVREIALEIETAQVHAWPLWLVNTARTRLEQTAGVSRLGCQISQMILWDAALN